MRYQSINWKYVFVFILVIAIVFSGFYTFFPDLLYGIGKIYESAGKQDVAQDYYEKILQIDPMSPMIAFTTHRKFLNEQNIHI
jgi:tetratricopeptide (TPR) repeat protein